MHKTLQKQQTVLKPGYKRAIELMSQNQLRSAMEQLEEALRTAPDNAEYLSLYGLCVARYSENYPLAIKLCERAIQLNPDPIFRVNLGKVYRMRGDNATAHKTFTRAWSENKTHHTAATELIRMGIRRPPVLSFLPRSHWLNIRLGKLRAALEALQRWR